RTKAQTTRRPQVTWARVPVVAVALASTVLALAAQSSRDTEPSYPFRDAGPLSSPRMVKLLAEAQRNREAAIEQFWNEVTRGGAPLVELIAGDDAHSHVTFVWRGSAAAKNVVITDGVSIGVGDAEPRKSEMTRIPRTDVWYRTYDVRNDARFTYALSENDPLISFIASDRKSNSKPDPLNARRFLTRDVRRRARRVACPRQVTTRDP